MDIVILGLSISSSWGNGHATTYRHLVRGLRQLGHQVLFLERDVEWYRANRDNTELLGAELAWYQSLEQLRAEYADQVRQADLVIVGSYVPDGIEVGDWVLHSASGCTAFYDIDTPVTLADLRRGACSYLTIEQIAAYDIYLSFAGGPALEQLARYGSPNPRPLYCSVDEQEYQPRAVRKTYDLGYMGTYSLDRQGGLERFLIEPARVWPNGRFVVAGAQYPATVEWSNNIVHIEHLPPEKHADFYCSQRLTLNLTRECMRQLGYAPSIRLFEAAACGTPLISDDWPGLAELFQPGQELLIAHSTVDVLNALQGMSDEELQRIGLAARARVLDEHTGLHRARELEQYVHEQSVRIA